MSEATTQCEKKSFDCPTAANIAIDSIEHRQQFVLSKKTKRREYARSYYLCQECGMYHLTSQTWEEMLEIRLRILSKETA